jgi:uncharacterized secreted repeat protein (TIGR03808 family)
MTGPTPLSRRHVLAGLGASSVLLPLASQAAPLAAADFGVLAGVEEDQTARLEEALRAARSSGAVLYLPPGPLAVADLAIPGNVVVEGVPGSTRLTNSGSGGVATIRNADFVILRHIGFAGVASGPLLHVEAGESITLDHCSFAGGSDIGLSILDAALTITECDFADHPDAAIHSMNSRGLTVRGNRIARCGNAGIRIWRAESGPDRSIVVGNRISQIDWRGGGNGENGNGINVFKADEVIIADNHIADCAFTAVRLNSTNNTQISGNTCLRSREVAIFSEFAFSGSIIANNIVDGAGCGISMTNFNEGGYLAVCSGNIVRNILPSSPVNPDISPVGIFAEADVAVTGNAIERVPGIGIVAGYGTYLRNVLIADNVVTATHIGIGVSVVDGAGTVQIGDNIIHDALEHELVGLAWSDVVETDLRTNAAQYGHVVLR